MLIDKIVVAPHLHKIDKDGRRHYTIRAIPYQDPQQEAERLVLEECLRRAIAFVPFAPLGSGARRAGSALDSPAILRVAVRLHCSPAQVSLAWALHSAPNILLIPGTASRAHLRENLAAVAVRLDDDALSELSLPDAGAPTPR